LYNLPLNVEVQQSSEQAALSAQEKIGMLMERACGSERERDEAKQNMEHTNALLSSRIRQLESKLQLLEDEGVSASSNTSTVTNEVSYCAHYTAVLYS